MPLIAQQFVDSLQNATFDFTLNPDNKNNKHDFPSQSSVCQPNESTSSRLREQGKDRAGKETSPRGQKSRIAEAKRKAMERAEADGVYNWPDERMSQTFHVSRRISFQAAVWNCFRRRLTDIAFARFD